MSGSVRPSPFDTPNRVSARFFIWSARLHATPARKFSWPAAWEKERETFGKNETFRSRGQRSGRITGPDGHVTPAATSLWSRYRHCGGADGLFLGLFCLCLNRHRPGAASVLGAFDIGTIFRQYDNARAR